MFGQFMRGEKDLFPTWAVFTVFTLIFNPLIQGQIGLMRAAAQQPAIAAERGSLFGGEGMLIGLMLLHGLTTFGFGYAVYLSARRRGMGLAGWAASGHVALYGLFYGLLVLLTVSVLTGG